MRSKSVLVAPCARVHAHAQRRKCERRELECEIEAARNGSTAHGSGEDELPEAATPTSCAASSTRTQARTARNATPASNHTQLRGGAVKRGITILTATEKPCSISSAPRPMICRPTICHGCTRNTGPTKSSARQPASEEATKASRMVCLCLGRVAVQHSASHDSLMQTQQQPKKERKACCKQRKGCGACLFLFAGANQFHGRRRLARRQRVVPCKEDNKQTRRASNCGARQRSRQGQRARDRARCRTRDRNQ